jgi:hypothetical protein
MIITHQYQDGNLEVSQKKHTSVPQCLQGTQQLRSWAVECDCNFSWYQKLTGLVVVEDSSSFPGEV